MADSESSLERERESKENHQLKVENGEQKKRLAELERENKSLKEQLAQALRSSQNSSKRPSSDIVKPRGARRGSGRKIGGQPGHLKHERPAFAPDEIDKTICYTLNCCPDCMGPL